ncbi:MAG: hypothetical protein CL450_04220 [Acidimicrobiaceae bacterium]|nr:hypothetical protein [Acidimicrobiaceae bacterium]
MFVRVNNKKFAHNKQQEQFDFFFLARVLGETVVSILTARGQSFFFFFLTVHFVFAFAHGVELGKPRAEFCLVTF